MDAGKIAFTAAHRFEAAGAADGEELGAKAACLQLAEQKVKTDAMAADDDEIGRFQTVAQQMDLDRRSSLDIFLLPRNDDEPVGPAKRRYRARAFAHRVRRQFVVALHEADEQILGSATLRIDAHRQTSRNKGGRF